MQEEELLLVSSTRRRASSCARRRSFSRTRGRSSFAQANGALISVKVCVKFMLAFVMFPVQVSSFSNKLVHLMHTPVKVPYIWESDSSRGAHELDAQHLYRFVVEYSRSLI